MMFRRMDAEALELSDGAFDVAVCALGYMYLPDPEAAVHEAFRAGSSAPVDDCMGEDADVCCAHYAPGAYAGIIQL